MEGWEHLEGSGRGRGQGDHLEVCLPQTHLSKSLFCILHSLATRALLLQVQGRVDVYLRGRKGNWKFEKN